MGSDNVFNEAHLMEALVKRSAERHPKDACTRVEAMEFIRLFTGAITHALAKGETVTLSNFGTLRVADDAGKGRGKRYVSFRAGRALKRALKEAPDPDEQSEE
jgi:nucleoid DNA-binding protein